MNQILVTEKLYITPELKRKKRFYKFNFILSVVLIVILISFYVHSEYARNKEQEISEDMLQIVTENVTATNQEEIRELAEQQISNEQMYEDSAITEQTDNVWRIIISATEEETTTDQETSEEISEETETSNQNENVHNTTTYTASDGKTYDMVGKINIPKINVSYVILSKTSVEWLKVSPCRFYGPDEPNEVGNFCIAGHNYRNQRFFSKVPNLVVGDTIELTDLSGRTVKYRIYDKYIVDPEDTSCLNQDTKGKKIVTLITCTNDSQKRVIVKAKEA